MQPIQSSTFSYASAYACQAPPRRRLGSVIVRSIRIITSMHIVKDAFGIGSAGLKETLVSCYSNSRFDNTGLEYCHCEEWAAHIWGNLRCRIPGDCSASLAMTGITGLRIRESPRLMQNVQTVSELIMQQHDSWLSLRGAKRRGNRLANTS